MNVLAALQRAFELHQCGELSQARESYLEILRAEPTQFDALQLLGMVQWQQGDVEAGAEWMGRAMAVNEGVAEVRENYGKVLADVGAQRSARGDFAGAAAAYQRAVEMIPRRWDLWNNLANALRNGVRAEEAIEAYRRAAELEPASGVVLNNLASTLNDLGRCEEAVAALERAVELEPQNAEIASNLLLALHYVGTKSAGEMLELHRGWGERFARGEEDDTSVAPTGKEDRGRDAGVASTRELRVGFVSGDLREHPVGEFLEGVLGARPRGWAHVVCYSNLTRVDGTTQKLRELSDEWRDVWGVADEEVAKRVREDGIDVLVDLSGHTGFNRLLVMAHRPAPAPVLVTQFGYPDTTGVKAIDWRVTDGVMDPPGAEQFYTEKLWRMKRMAWCWRMPEAARGIEVGELPSLRRRTVTFGSLNNAAKINPGVMEVWAELLREVAGSRLVLLIPPGVAGRVKSFFESHGVDPGQVECVGRMARADYFRKYCQIDVALDPFPYNGATTTCDAMWMGVPVVALAGKTCVSRHAEAVVRAAGVGELVGRDEEEYVKIAAELARDVGRMVELRGMLRERFEKCAVMDVGGYARELFESYCEMLRRVDLQRS